MINPMYMLGAGAALGWLKSFWSSVYDHTIGHVLNRVKIDLAIEEQENSEAYMWLNMWAEKRLQKKKIISLRLKKNDDKDENPSSSQFVLNVLDALDGGNVNVKKVKDDDASSNNYLLIPNYGSYYFRYKRYLLNFKSSKSNDGGGRDDPSIPTAKASTKRAISVTIWGTRQRKLLLDIINEAREEFLTANQKLFYYTHHDSWWESSVFSPRTVDTIYLPAKQKSELLNDCQSFLTSKEKYSKMGIPWRRGLLFKGPPGTGKSTLVQVLATFFRLPIYYINLSSVFNSDQLAKLFRGMTTPCIALIEDVDYITAAKTLEKKNEYGDQQSLKTSDLLNVLDGLIASEGRILIMTTNNPEKLDPAIIRDGRIDKQFEITYSTDTEIKNFYDRARQFYTMPEWAEFRGGLPEKCTIANAQNLAFKYINQEI